MKEHSEARVKAYEDTLRDINREMEDRLKWMKQAFAVLDKMERLLPEGWGYTYQYFGYLTFHKNAKEGEQNNPLEFREVTRHLERILNRDIKRKYQEYSSMDSKYLVGECYVDGIQYLVRMGSPSCQVTYEEVVVPAVIKKVAKVPEECLGIRKPGEMDEGEAVAS